MPRAVLPDQPHRLSLEPTNQDLNDPRHLQELLPDNPEPLQPRALPQQDPRSRRRLNDLLLHDDLQAYRKVQSRRVRSAEHPHLSHDPRPGPPGLQQHLPHQQPEQTGHPLQRSLRT